uniref:Uncharacterized protein n=1 Tax=Acetithermum autotrophicum TaxID=1446466 RepID=H5SQG2_ACEAU|nr:hypothetical protein HGMM_OP1C093 [Candidatus Acetothermum autotrophicum]
MRSFEHINATDLQTAVALLGEASTEAIAGGTDLLGELKGAPAQSTASRES